MQSRPTFAAESAVVDVWWIPFGPGSAGGVDPDSLLSPEETRRAARFRFPEHATRYRRSHAALRLVLGSYLGEPAERLEFTSVSGGKPRLVGNSRLCFNLSHSGDLAVVAVAFALEVGVDVEKIRMDFPVEGPASFLSAREMERVRATGTGEARARTFFRLWTRKEAVLKAEGSGISGLDRLDISVSPPEPVRFPPDTTKLWRLEDLEAPAGYAASLAAPAGNWSVRYRHM